jgi:hypothetical protein
LERFVLGQLQRHRREDAAVVEARGVSTMPWEPRQLSLYLSATTTSRFSLAPWHLAPLTFGTVRQPSHVWPY